MDSTGSVSNSICYAGYQYDDETGYYYLNARMYDPWIGRFLQEDTVTGDKNGPLSLNLYTYTKNNPTRYYDPTGHFGWDIFIDAVNTVKTIYSAIKADPVAGI